MRDFILFESDYWDPAVIFVVLLLMFWQTCAVKKAKRSYATQAVLLLVYMAALTAVAAFFMLEPGRDPRINLIIAGVTVFFFSSSLSMLFVARAWIPDYGVLRAALMLVIMASTAVAAFLFHAYHGISLPLFNTDLPFVATASMIFLVHAGALLLEGVLYDLLVFRRTNMRVLCLYSLSVTCAVFGYYIYMTRGLTEPLVF